MTQVVCKAKSWLDAKLARLNEKGQATSEYVLLILGVVLFLIVAAFALRGALSGAVTAITNWIAGVTPPPV